MTSTTHSKRTFCLQIFTKAPTLVPVKTRLSSTLSQRQRQELYKSLIRHTLQTCSSIPQAQQQLWVTPKADDFLKELSQQHKAQIHLQTGQDLGQRMHHALSSGIQAYGKALLMGCDCPFIDVRYLEQALTAVSHRPDSCVLGPADDGGYVLIGANQQLPTGVFEGVAWGTDEVLQQTRIKLSQYDIPVTLLPSLSDIDVPADLQKLPQHLQIAGM